MKVWGIIFLLVAIVATIAGFTGHPHQFAIAVLGFILSWACFNQGSNTTWPYE